MAFYENGGTRGGVAEGKRDNDDSYAWYCA